MRIEYSRQAAKAVRKIPRLHAMRIIEAIDLLSEDPFPAHSTKLSDSSAHRIRVGTYRVIYHIHEEVLLVDTIDKRGRVYKR